MMGGYSFGRIVASVRNWFGGGGSHGANGAPAAAAAPPALEQVDARNYEATEKLRDGRTLAIRAFRPGDRAALETAAARLSTQTLYRRFFTVKRHFSEREKKFFLNVDFIDHVALMAWAEDDGQEIIVAGGRYVVTEPGKAEVAFVVIDPFQGQGIGSVLMRHLAIIARAAGLDELVAEVLPENKPMLKVFAKSGLRMTTASEPEVAQVSLKLH